MPTSIYILVLVTFQIVPAPSELYCLYSNSWTPLIQSPKGKGKWFKLAGVQINEVKISSKARVIPSQITKENFRLTPTHLRF